MKRPIVLILIGLALGGLVLLLALRFPDALTTRGDQIQLTHALLLVAVIGGSARETPCDTPRSGLPSVRRCCWAIRSGASFRLWATA